MTSELLDHLSVERRNVVGLAARDEPVVGDDLLIDPDGTRVLQVILDAANALISENRDRLGKTLFTARSGGKPVVLVTVAVRVRLAGITD